MESIKKRRKFTSEQKTQITLAIIKGDITLSEASRKHEITPSLLAKWKDQFLANATKAFEVNQEDQEKDKKIKKYEHIITKITTQNDFLEKILKTVE